MIELCVMESQIHHYHLLPLKPLSILLIPIHEGSSLLSHRINQLHISNTKGPFSLSLTDHHHILLLNCAENFTLDENLSKNVEDISHNTSRFCGIIVMLNPTCKHNAIMLSVSQLITYNIMCLLFTSGKYFSLFKMIYYGSKFHAVTL
jgi:hypothetical protein